MMRTGLLLSASVATLFARRAAGDDVCTTCIASGTFCAYETSDDKAGYGICYEAALGNLENCPEVYGALDQTYGADNALTAKTFSSGADACDDGAKALVDANIVTFTDYNAGDAVTGVTSCSDCISAGNTWCQPKDTDDANLAGGYCSVAGTDCITLLESETFATMEAMTETCPSTSTSTDAPANPCLSCVNDSKLFCAYSTGSDGDKTYLYHACIDGRNCPTMAGIDAIYAGLKEDTEVTAEKVNEATNCMEVPKEAGLNLAAGAPTDSRICSDCVSKSGKWCDYATVTGIKSGYCGVDQTCAKFDDFDGTTISNVPDTREPSTECGSPSAGFALTSSSIALATCAAALAISA